MKHELIIGKYTLESLTNGMYASPLDLYREYIQNAVDSFDEAVNQGLIIPHKLRIDITIDPEARCVIIHDNGCGIKSDIASSALLDIGNSRKSNHSFRGFRGIGRLAGLSYCNKLTFRTSYQGEETSSVIEFDAKLLKELLIPGASDNATVEDVIDQIATVRIEKEIANRRYFEVILDGVWDDAGLTDITAIQDYLVQHAPLHYSSEFKWGRTIEEKLRMNGFKTPQYHIFLNKKELFKPYEDTFLSDRVKRHCDIIQDICIETFFRGETLSAILWYAKTNYYGTIIDNLIKGIRIRQGNILIGDKSSCNSLFKEERFNGWMIGELHIIDKDIIANSRRDGFEKNAVYYELMEKLREWALGVSKEIRHVSYERSLTSSKKAIAEADRFDEVDNVIDENNLCSETYIDADDCCESSYIDQSESDELAETDYISKLGLFLTQKKAQTKYAALNINEKITIEQRRILERVFDVISKEYESNIAEAFIDTILRHF